LSDEEILRIAEANVRDYYDRKLTETPEPIRSWICPDPYRTREDEELAVKQIAVPSANEDLLEKRSVEEKE
jgi:hypothetical protein